jgi:hypothetical protein
VLFEKERHDFAGGNRRDPEMSGLKELLKDYLSLTLISRSSELRFTARGAIVGTTFTGDQRTVIGSNLFPGNFFFRCTPKGVTSDPLRTILKGAPSWAGFEIEKIRQFSFPKRSSPLKLSEVQPRFKLTGGVLCPDEDPQYPKEQTRNSPFYEERAGPRRIAPNSEERREMISCKIPSISSSLKVFSGERKESRKARDFLPSGTGAPV